MRWLLGAILLAGLMTLGCGESKPFDGPTVDAFNGRLVQDGKPLSIPENQNVSMEVFFEKGNRFGIPLQPDGSFKIGWMPIGKYSVMLRRSPKKEQGAPLVYNVPGGMTIQEGKTDYTIEVGSGWKP